MTKKYNYEVEGVESGYIPNVGEVKEGKITTSVELVGSQYKLVGEEDDTPESDALNAEEPTNPAADIYAPSVPVEPQAPINPDQGQTAI
jgi:hypothetical protein